VGARGVAVNPFACRIEPDSLTGAILAVEGIRDAAVLLNGPTGCKFFHGAIAEGQLPRESSYDPLQFLDEFYFGQPRVPTTYLDGEDYIFGATDKLERILPAVAQKKHSLIAVINSPGAALIGDDLERFVHKAGLSVPCVTIESTSYSGTFGEGFQQALLVVLEALEPPSTVVEPRMVLLSGLSIAQRHWAGDATELRRLLNLCGIEVGAVLCAGTTTSNLRGLRKAALNVMVHQGLAEQTTLWLKDRFGIDTVEPVSGAPIGFDQTEAWIRWVCDHVGADPTPAVKAIDTARMRAVMHIKRLNSLTGLPKGACFGLYAPCSVALPLTRWLYHYLGMIPATVRVTDADSPLAVELANDLNTIDCGASMNRDIDATDADIVFADGATLTRMEIGGRSPAGVEIALPSRGYIDIVPKCMLGAQGTLYLLEAILNELNRH
jgi:nitrogenase molybdenum-iron protein alpha/beta subunit